MKDLSSLVMDCRSMLDEQNVPYVKEAPVSINYRATRRLGVCKLRSGEFSIEISAYILGDSVNEDIIKSAIIHEYLHTCPNCMNHGDTWKKWATIMSSAYKGIDVTRTICLEGTGIEKPEKAKTYCVACEKCRYEITRSRKSKLVVSPELYTHTGCGGRFVRVR